MSNLTSLIEIISKEKGIDREVVIDALKDALLAAARRQFRNDEQLEAEFDERTGAIRIYAVKQVVEQVKNPATEVSVEEASKYEPNAQPGDLVRIPKPTEALGRISAQTARQVILQRVQDAERDRIYREYSKRVGELVTGIVKRYEGKDLIIDLGRTEARLPRREQSPIESFNIGERIRCVIKSVEKSGKNAGVIVSRAAPELVIRLFEQEVPEIYDNTVVIKACAREPGERTKLAVASRDPDIDPVGACVGIKGMRVQSIIRELRGERIDIIQYSEDPAEFAKNALSPAKVLRVNIIDPEKKHMEVIVDESQLSLAIGKRGQNVRLASKLLGWRIDIKTEEQKRREAEAALVGGAPVTVLTDHGLSEAVIDILLGAGIETVEMLGSMTPEQLLEIPGIDDQALQEIYAAVNSYYAQFEMMGAEDLEMAGEYGEEPLTEAASEQVEPKELPETTQSQLQEVTATATLEASQQEELKKRPLNPEEDPVEPQNQEAKVEPLAVPPQKEDKRR